VTLRVGVIGLGFGAAVHVPGWRAVPGVEVVAIAGRSHERAQASASALGIPNADPTAEALLQRDLDAVSIAVPPAAAVALVETALARGLAVLTEKPLAGSLADAERLAAAARGKQVAVDFQIAELESFAAFEAFVRSGQFGKPVRGDLLWLSWSRAYAFSQWGWKLAAGEGGVVNLFGSHVLYLVERFFGPVCALQAHTSATRSAALSPAGAQAAEDTLELAAEFAGGMRFGATISNAAPGAAVHRWTVVFERGTVVLESHAIDQMSGFSLVATDGARRETMHMVEPFSKGDPRIAPFARLAGRFAAALRSADAMRPDFADGLRVQRLMDCVRCSNAEGAKCRPI
jgi:predicted dehydrogenase